jgi:hypothetical protein
MRIRRATALLILPVKKKNTSQKTPRHLCNQKVHYRFHKSPSVVPVPNLMNPVHTLPPNFPNIHSTIVLPSTPRSSEWSLPFRFSDQNFVCISQTNSMEQSPWEADSHSASQGAPRLFGNPKVNYHIHKILPLVPHLGQMNPVHNFPKIPLPPPLAPQPSLRLGLLRNLLPLKMAEFLGGFSTIFPKIHSNIILPSTSSSSEWSLSWRFSDQNLLMNFSVYITFHTRTVHYSVISQRFINWWDYVAVIWDNGMANREGYWNKLPSHILNYLQRCPPRAVGISFGAWSWPLTSV